MSSTVIPCVRYQDAHAAIEWLCGVIGFRRHLVVGGEGGTIVHAQLVLGDGMIMVSSVIDSPAAGLFTQPAEIGGRESQSPYVLVQDADAVHARVKARGGKILLEIQDNDYGGRGFSCADPEGHVWHVGTYDPWDSKQA